MKWHRSLKNAVMKYLRTANSLLYLGMILLILCFIATVAVFQFVPNNIYLTMLVGVFASGVFSILHGLGGRMFIATLILTMYLPISVVFWVFHGTASPQELLGYGLLTIFASGIVFLCEYYYLFSQKKREPIVRTEHTSGDRT